MDSGRGNGCVFAFFCTLQNCACASKHQVTITQLSIVNVIVFSEKTRRKKKKFVVFFLFIFVWFLFVWFCFLPGPYCVSHRNPFIILNLAWVRDISPLGWPPTANKYPDWIQPSHGFGLKRIQCNWFNKVVYQSHGQKISNYKCSHMYSQLVGEIGREQKEKKQKQNRIPSYL